MKQRIIGIILMIGLLSGMTACGSTQSARSEESEITQESQSVASQEDQSAAVQESQTEADADTQNMVEEATSLETETVEQESNDNNVLVVYFSCTNSTKGVAEMIANVSGAALYEIEAAVPYTSADIDYNDSSSRSTIEQNDSSARPEIATTVSNMENYQYVFIGYPIWWGEEPRIIDTFIESYDFTGKTLIPFCTSASSSIKTSEENLRALIGDTSSWLNGKRFSAGTQKTEIEEWISSLNID
jgi:flavodoxin